MQLIFSEQMPHFYCEASEWPGVKRVCGLVRRDAERVTGHLPPCAGAADEAVQMVIAATVGRSPLLETLEGRGCIDLSGVRGKWEVYAFQLVQDPLPGVETALIIAGSDKRGTIYGLFRLSELLGVSPLADWAEVRPPRRDRVVLTEAVNRISKEPSVRYRGIFINDEWPALGTWATTRFGGFNAEMYAHVFELILRLKGNYLWPAMWNANFSLDGPGLANAELADEMGIVIGTSHHEPCMRAGGEYGRMRGKDSIYGDAWNFRTNREGILRFWQDGLIRSAPFESMITVGMRGEDDTAILQHASLKDNIDLLRDVLQEQNRLIRTHISPDLQAVRRLFVLFTEVEAFFYGSEQTPGLLGDPELDGVTLMLTDDNFGNLRSLPTREMQAHQGGFGLYYHLDFHGGAYAYDWMNTNYLPKMWEQLTTAWEGGIREVWIANIGDISLLEYPLCYFMDMAYDMEAFGAADVNGHAAWTAQWVQQQFGAAFSAEDCQTIRELLDRYSWINYCRKPEVMNRGVYHPTHFGETSALMALAEGIERDADRLLQVCPAEVRPSFWELVYYPAAASANHCLLWLHAERNRFYAEQGRMEANDEADAMQRCILRDRALTAAYHTVGEGRFYGLALSEHIGFKTWCEEGNLYPAMMRVEGANKPRLIAADSAGEAFSIGTRWTGHDLFLRGAMHPDVSAVQLDLACGSRDPVCYTAETDCPWLTLSHWAGCVSRKHVLTIGIDRKKLQGCAEGVVTVRSVSGTVRVHVLAQNVPEELPEGVFLETEGILCMEAAHFASKHDVPGAAWTVLSPWGRAGTGLRVMPLTVDCCHWADRPWVEYRFFTPAGGAYLLDLYMGPCNTATMAHRLCFGLSMNGGAMREINAAGEHFRSLDLKCREWDSNVRNNIRIKTVPVTCKAGENVLRIAGGSPMVLLERLVLHPADRPLPASYLGPKESCIRKGETRP